MGGGNVMHDCFINEMYLSPYFYSESRERLIQTIMKVSSKCLNCLPIFFSNSMVDRKVDLTFERTLALISFIFISIFISDWFTNKCNKYFICDHTSNLLEMKLFVQVIL